MFGGISLPNRLLITEATETSPATYPVGSALTGNAGASSGSQPMLRWRSRQTLNGHVQGHSRRSVVASFYSKAPAADTTTMAIEDFVVLSQQDVPTLAQWWCSLNSWSWPRGLANPQIPGVMLNGRRSGIMRWIEGSIGMRECLREWNRDKMDAETFDEFWLGAFEGVEGARQRFMAWLDDEESHPCTACTAVQRRKVRERVRAILRERGR